MTLKLQQTQLSKWTGVDWSSKDAAAQENRGQKSSCILLHKISNQLNPLLLARAPVQQVFTDGSTGLEARQQKARKPKPKRSQSAKHGASSATVAAGASATQAVAQQDSRQGTLVPTTPHTPALQLGNYRIPKLFQSQKSPLGPINNRSGRMQKSGFDPQYKAFKNGQSVCRWRPLQAGSSAQQPSGSGNNRQRQNARYENHYALLCGYTSLYASELDRASITPPPQPVEAAALTLIL